jgi:hypothetical protein
MLEHNDRMMKEGTISANDPSLYLVTDSIEEAINYIKEKSIIGFKLGYERQPRPFWGFFEKGLKSSLKWIPGTFKSNE